jgi:putative ABC transport system ATP-binding protein
VIELIEVRKVYNLGRPNEFAAVRGVTLSIREGEVTVLRGPSGSGKTTLLGLIGCMSRPTSGRIRLGDRELTSLPERFLTEVRRKTFGFVFQQFHLLRGTTALENVMVPAYPLGERQGRLRTRALELLESLGLAEKARSPIEWLSGGEAQRVAIARALINDPTFVLADEPTAHLDSALSQEFLGIVVQLRAAGKTIVIASHDPQVFEASAVQRVVHLRDGRLDGGSR